MNRRLNVLSIFALIFTLLAIPAWGDDESVMVALSKQASPEVSKALDEAFYSYHVFELDLGAINKRVRADGRLNLHLGNQTFALELEENNLRGEGYRNILFTDKGAKELPVGPVSTFKGIVAGDPDSMVRLSVTSGLFSGFIHTHGETLYIDPVSDFMADKAARPASDVVAYREIDTRGLEAGTCEAKEHNHEGPQQGPRLAGPGIRMHGFGADLLAQVQDQVANKAVRSLEIALECDGQYWAAFGSGSYSRMEGIVNSVTSVIYDSELDTSLNIVFSGCWQSISGDPYTSLNASTTLSQMRSWWNANGNTYASNRDVTHQFSGKNFSGSTIGIAYVGVICNSPSNSYGISQDVSGSASRRRLTAHEIGHNLSANHDGSGTNCSGNGPIMCPSIQSGGSSNADDFSNQSLNSINNHIASFGSCI